MARRKRIFFETQEVIKKTKRGYIDLEMDYFQFYAAAFSHVASLSSNCSKDFILWVMARVDENNKFTYSKDLYREFNADLQRISKPKVYAESTMNMALRELSEAGIIFRASRGEYTVNPKLFWSEEVSQRVKSIQLMKTEERHLPEHDSLLYPKFTEAELEEVPPVITTNPEMENGSNGCVKDEDSSGSGEVFQ
jgi:hypothetical protein